MKVALFQIDTAFENKSMNFKKVESLVKNIKEKVDLIILPELFSTGYTMNPDPLAEDSCGPTSSFLSKLAKKHKTNVLGSFIEKTETKPKNSAILFDINGNLILHYSKIHQPTYCDENKHYTPGKDIRLIELNSHKLAVTICYDLRFPELFRKAVQKGAECIIVIASWPEQRIEHWDILLRARAIENQLYIIGVNRVGKSTIGNCPGHSVVIDPLGKVISSTEDNQEGIITAEIDFNKVKKTRHEFPALKDMVLDTIEQD